MRHVRPVLLLVATSALLTAVATPVRAQQSQPALPPSAQQAAARLREEQQELEQLRAERQELESRMKRLQTSARDISAERQNLERQAAATSRVVRSLEQQLGSLMNEVQTINEGLVRSQDEMRIKRATLRHRVQEIYKRGPLYSLEALLSAESFGALVARYKYLNLVARRDRSLVARVETLTGQISAQRSLLVRLQGDMESNRQQKAEEEQRLRRLEVARGRSLAQVQAQARTAQQRLQQVQRDEQRLAGVIAALEDARRRAESRSGAAPTRSSVTTGDLGRLDWPVEGKIIYRYGRVVNPNSTRVIWNGIGISAPAGTPVKAVAAGEIVIAEVQGTYGLTVLVHHGGGSYAMYASLRSASVRKGARIAKGDVIGTVGQSDPDMPARLHFEMRPNNGRAVDPLEWLRRQR